MDGDVADRFQQVFWTAKKAMTDAAEHAYGRHGVRAGQHFVLMELWREDGLTPGELARRLKLATPTVTKATTRMEAAGLVHRRPHPGDKRLVRIHLSDEGERLRGVMAEEMRALSERALSGLTADEREDFVRLLGLLRANIGDPAGR
jgi:MarR family transcriptional regulator, organic hydroperoxide resistance regulator